MKPLVQHTSNSSLNGWRILSNQTTVSLDEGRMRVTGNNIWATAQKVYLNIKEGAQYVLRFQLDIGTANGFINVPVYNRAITALSPNWVSTNKSGEYVYRFKAIDNTIRVLFELTPSNTPGSVIWVDNVTLEEEVIAPTAYRFGFNGKENDNEVSGSGNQQDYGFRIYNPRLGRFLSVDPLTQSYPWYTPFQFAGNKPTVAIDMDGLEEFFVHEYTLKNSAGKEFLYRVDYSKVSKSSKVTTTPNTVARVIRANYKSSVGRNANIYRTYMKGYNKDQASASPIIDYSGAIMNSMRDNTGNNGSPMTLIALQTTGVQFKPDQGVTQQEVKAQFESPANQAQKTALDNLAVSLVNDPSLKALVKGYASNTPTNINGTEPETNVQNNEALATMRANAGKAYLLDYIKNTLKVDNFDESRIQAKSVGVLEGGRDPNTKQGVTFKPVQ